MAARPQHELGRGQSTQARGESGRHWQLALVLCSPENWPQSGHQGPPCARSSCRPAAARPRALGFSSGRSSPFHRGGGVCPVPSSMASDPSASTGVQVQSVALSGSVCRFISVTDRSLRGQLGHPEVGAQANRGRRPRFPTAPQPTRLMSGEGLAQGLGLWDPPAHWGPDGSRGCRCTAERGLLGQLGTLGVGRPWTTSAGRAWVWGGRKLPEHAVGGCCSPDLEQPVDPGHAAGGIV